MKHSFRGRHYTTLKACYEDNVDQITVGIATVRNRLKDGWSLEDALLRPKATTKTSKSGPFLVRGTLYPNLKAVAEAFGMSTDAVYKRASRGKEGDELVADKRKKRREKKHKFVAGGKGYPSAAAACKALGVKYVTYRSRLGRGLTPDQALGLAPVVDGRSARGQKYELHGKTWSAQELADHFSISIQTLYSRLRRGASIEQAVGLVSIRPGELKAQKDIQRQPRAAIDLVVDGKHYSSYAALGRAYDLPQHTLRQRIVEYGWSVEEAVKRTGKSKPVEFRGRQYASTVALAEAHGVPVEEFRSRRNLGWSVAEALGLEKHLEATAFDFEGEMYNSLAELADAKGISRGALRSRIRAGMSIAESVAAGARIKNPGKYNLGVFEDDPDLANAKGFLYFVEIIMGGQARHKVGITSKTVAHRLKHQEYRLLKSLTGRLEDCFKAEQRILERMGDKRDNDLSSDAFDGYTEILVLDDRDVQNVLEWMAVQSVIEVLAPQP